LYGEFSFFKYNHIVAPHTVYLYVVSQELSLSLYFSTHTFPQPSTIFVCRVPSDKHNFIQITRMLAICCAWSLNGAAATLIYEFNVRLRFITELFESTPCEIVNNIKVMGIDRAAFQISFNSVTELNIGFMVYRK